MQRSILSSEHRRTRPPGYGLGALRSPIQDRKEPERVRYILDSAFLIDHLRGVAAASARMRRLWEEGDEGMVTEVVTCEVWAGARDPDDRDLIALLEPLEFVVPGPYASMMAGRWRADARALGRTLSLADALIAASAEGLGAAVLTRNVRDFSLTPVRLETY